MAVLDSRALILLGVFLGLTQDFDRQVRDAYEKVKPVVERNGKLIDAGRRDEANDAVLAVFPEGTRTPVQAYLLGNLIFGNDPARSYALHKFAVEKLPTQAEVQLEWAMEQHRAGEYPGAAEAYARYTAEVPEYAPAWGLAADCLIRQGKIREAVAAWSSSEKSKAGSLERFESLVCDIYTSDVPLARRQRLLDSMKKGDLNAGVELIAFGCHCPKDWWNIGPQKAILENDLAVFRSLKFPAGRRIDAIECMAECFQAEPEDGKAVLASLVRSGFLVDPGLSLPEDSKVAALLIDRAVATGAIKPGEVRKKLAEKVIAAARSLRNADLWNTGLYLLADQKVAAIEKEAWEATGDVRFALGYLLLSDKELTLGDEVFQKALKVHPESGELVRVAIALARKEGKVTEGLLVQGIKAEFRHFSSTGVLPRPKAATLRAYFRELAKIVK